MKAADAITIRLRSGELPPAPDSSRVIAKNSCNYGQKHFAFAQGVREPKVIYDGAKECKLPFYTKEFLLLAKGIIATIQAFV
jgi:hypothetical protein